MSRLAVRERRDEQMDDPSLDPEVYAKVLRDLSRVNAWTLARRPTIAFLRQALGDVRRFRLLDVGFGQGDMLRAIARWAQRRGIEAELIGVDLNDKSLAAARAATPPDLAIDYRIGDYGEVEGEIDFVVSSLVAHHMTDEQLRRFLRYMEEKARRGWLVNDLHRHRLSHLGFPILARMLRAHRIVREDGTLSIARAFRPGEWRAILAEARIPEGAARVVRRFPFRLCVERLR
jgi:2-polyprenyl-3-methyl-5-hydroxy-6-metoxy-1,4-benzoquinol methylase